MRQYQVPQFIDIEDQIIGPLTLRQFIYLVAGGAIVVLGYYLLTLIFFIMIALPVALISLALAFVKINGIPFATMLGNAIGYFSKPHLYIWKQLPPKKVSVSEVKESTISSVPKLTESKLQDLAWSLDIKGEQGIGTGQ